MNVKHKSMPFREMMDKISRPAVVQRGGSELYALTGSATSLDIPVPTRKTHQWQFPLGDKIATLHITGESKLVTEDMDALIEITSLFRASVIRANSTIETDYEI